MNEIYKYLLTLGLQTTVFGVVVYLVLNTFVKNIFRVLSKRIEVEIELILEKKKIVFSKLFEEREQFTKTFFSLLLDIESKLTLVTEQIQDNEKIQQVQFRDLNKELIQSLESLISNYDKNLIYFSQTDYALIQAFMNKTRILSVLAKQMDDCFSKYELPNNNLRVQSSTVITQKDFSDAKSIVLILFQDITKI